MKRLLALALLAAAGLLAATLPHSAPLAANAGCISFNQVGFSWKFRNNCGTRVEVAYCVRYAWGEPTTKYTGRFQFNNSLTVQLVDIPNSISINHCPAGACYPEVPPC